MKRKKKESKPTSLDQAGCSVNLRNCVGWLILIFVIVLVFILSPDGALR